MAEISKEDTEFFFRLESLNSALTLSSTDPIVIIDYMPIGEWFGELKTFWDCWENESEAREIMKGRIRLAPKDIDAHIQSHKRMLERFYSVQEAMNVHDRARVKSIVDELSPLVRLHENLVKAHKSIP